MISSLISPIIPSRNGHHRNHGKPNRMERKEEGIASTLLVPSSLPSEGGKKREGQRRKAELFHSHRFTQFLSFSLNVLWSLEPTRVIFHCKVEEVVYRRPCVRSRLHRQRAAWHGLLVSRQWQKVLCLSILVPRWFVRIMSHGRHCRRRKHRRDGQTWEEEDRFCHWCLRWYLRSLNAP